MHQAKLYAQSSLPWRKGTENVLRELLPRLRWDCEAAAGEGAAAMDVGCGPGNVSAELLLPLLPDSVRLVVGADESEDMVLHAAATCANPRLRFLRTDIAARDIHATPLGKLAADLGGFCKVFSFLTLHWVQDQRTALFNIHRLLRPGGEGLLTVAVDAPLYSAFKALRQQPRWSQYMTDVDTFISPYHLSADPEGDFSSGLQEVGFAVHECDRRDVWHHFPSLLSLREATTALNPFLARIPEEERSQYMSATMEECERHMVSLTSTDSKRNSAGKSDVCISMMVAHIEKSIQNENEI